MRHQHYEWQRFWCPRESSISLEDGGYLVDPTTEYGKTYYPGVVSFAQLATHPCLVLLGEPGMGKSDALSSEQTRQQRDEDNPSQSALHLDLRSFGSEDRLFRRLTESPDIQRWIVGDGFLEMFLDSLDECLLRVDTLATLLPEVLAQLPLERLRLRLACRTGDWPQTLEGELIKQWGQEHVAVYELAPLREVDVRVAATANNIDANEFLTEVAHREAQALANRPVTLNFLLRAKQNDGSLPTRKAELYLTGCRLLAGETNRARIDAGYRGRMNADERLGLAARVAAATIFGNRYAVWTGPEIGAVLPEDITFRDLRAQLPDPGGRYDEAIDEVLGTGLFSSRGPDRMGWAHQTYSEFLAARWAVESRLDLEQILALLVSPHDPDQRIVPQLRETAAWVATMHADVFQALIRLDPEALLRGDIATTNIEQRRDVTEALLNGYESERLLDMDWTLRPLYRKLAHPALANQLRPFIGDASKGTIVRRAAINMAEACVLADLQDDLLRVALNPGEPFLIREEAVGAAAAVTEPARLRELRPLLNIEHDEDPDDQLRGRVLQALWPDHLSVEELFRSLEPPRRPNLYGAYKQFVRFHLPQNLDDEHLPVALEWVQSHQIQDDSLPDILQELAEEILLRVWKNKPRGQQLDRLAEVVMLRSKEHVSLVGREQEQEFSELLMSDMETRQAIVVALLSKMKDENDIWALWRPVRLLSMNDVPWLLHWITQAESSDTSRRFGAQALLRLVNSDDVDQVNAILVAATHNEVVRTTFAGWIEPVDLDSSHATELKAKHNERAEREREDRERSLQVLPLDPSPSERIDAALAKCDAGDTDGFWQLTLELTLEPGRRRYEEFNLELTTTLGWLSADAETRTRIINFAKWYLRERDPETQRWLGTDIWYRPAIAGYKALRLLLTVESAYVAQLPQSEWARWAPAIVAYSSENQEPGLTLESMLVCAAYKSAPQEALDALSNCVIRDNAKYGLIFGLERFEPCWDNAFSTAILAHAVRADVKIGTFRTLLQAALGHGLTEASTFAFSLIQPAVPSEPEQREKAVVCAAILLSHSPEEAWKPVWYAIQQDDEFGRSLVSELAGAQRGRALKSLSEDQLALLYIWIARHCPYVEKPGYDSLDETGMFLNALLTVLQNRGSFGAGEAIQRIMRELPNVGWLKYTLHAARERARSKTWNPPHPVDLFQLGGPHEGRLVRSGRELLEAIIASLRRLNTKLQDETPAAIDLWNGPDSDGKYRPKDENALSNYVKRHLDEDLKQRGVVVNREVEIRRGEGEARGERTDIHVDAVVRGEGGAVVDVVTAIVEAKGCWNRELSIGMETQLVGRYLKDNSCNHGLYLVGWYNCPQWDAADYRKAQTPKHDFHFAQQQFDSQAAQLSTSSNELRSFVLNAALR